ncbi:MAG: ZIP family metal transporter [Firmicutes bacterium]|nr:ZIP family metal transporter [Bacillota bacterium]
MAYLAKITLFGLISGITGTGIGALMALAINRINNRLLSFILEFSGGLMTAVVCFELIPEALELSGTITTFTGIFSGIIAIMLIENYIKQSDFFKKSRGNSNLLKTGVLMAIGIALHNFPEGFAVGSGFQASLRLGATVTLVIVIHDIPEGIAMALPMRSGGFTKARTFFYTLLSGIPMGIGALLGALLGGISTDFIAACLGFAAGAMLYIVFVELVPESKKIYLGRLSSIGNVLGIVCGIMISIYN